MSNWPSGLPLTSTAIAAAPTTTHDTDWYTNVVKPISDALTGLMGPDEASWITPVLGNSWVAFGAPHPPLQYQIFGVVVRMRGFIKSGTINTVIFNLPVGYRPSAQLLFPANSSGGYAAVTVDTTGNVEVNAYETGASNAGVSFDQIEFFAD